MKKAVVYFSASGVTARVARRLAASVGADIFEIVPVQPYTDADLDWTDKNSRSSLEMKNPDSRPEFIETGLNLLLYDEVLIGFPIWWYIAPTIINTFIESLDFTGKIVRAFATSGGSGIENCEKNLQKQYPSFNWKSGKLLNNTESFDAFVACVSEKK